MRNKYLERKKLLWDGVESRVGTDSRHSLRNDTGRNDECMYYNKKERKLKTGTSFQYGLIAGLDSRRGKQVNE